MSADYTSKTRNMENLGQLKAAGGTIADPDTGKEPMHYSGDMIDTLRRVRKATGRARKGEVGYSDKQKPTKAFKVPKIDGGPAMTAHQRKADEASK